MNVDPRRVWTAHTQHTVSARRISVPLKQFQYAVLSGIDFSDTLVWIIMATVSSASKSVFFLEVKSRSCCFSCSFRPLRTNHQEIQGRA